MTLLLRDRAFAIVLRSFDHMHSDLDREKKIAIDDQKIANHSCPGYQTPFSESVEVFLQLGSSYVAHHAVGA